MVWYGTTPIAFLVKCRSTQQWNPYLICQLSDFFIFYSYLHIVLFILCVRIILKAKASNIGSINKTVAERAVIMIKTSTVRTE